MYELNLSNHKKFCKAAKEKMKERNITLDKLSGMTSYSGKSLKRFFEGRKSRFIAAAISDALEIYEEGEVKK